MVTLNKETRQPIEVPKEVIARLSPWSLKGQA
jgi:hypothetical protein